MFERVYTSYFEKRDLRLGKRTFLSLYSKHFNDFVELLMELKHCVRGFIPGSGKHLTCICNRWLVLLATGRWCQSVYVRVEIGTSALS